MRKRALLAFLMILVLLISTGCSLIVKDEAVDRATVIIEVADKAYTKGEIQDQMNYMMDYYESMYTSYGLSFDRNDSANIADIQNTVINAYIDEAVIRQKITEGGYDQFTAEEQETINATVEEDYQLYYDTVEMFYFSDTELTGDELTAAIEAEMANLGYPTKEQLLESETLTKAQEKLRAEVVKDVVVSDEELNTEYQARVDSAKATYEATPGSYGTDVSNDAVIYYVPAGYRYVKHILIGYSDEDQTAISELETELSNQQAVLTNNEASLELIGDDPSTDTEEVAANRAEITATIETATAEIAALEAQIQEAKAAANAAIQSTVDEVAAKIAAGEDFDALIEQYNTDPGMTADSMGYPVSADTTNWVAEFQDASMALANVGDVSGAVNTTYGVHFIKYASDAVEGPVALETVKDAITSELLTTKQDTLYTTTVEQWVEEANAKIYEDRL